MRRSGPRPRTGVLLCTCREELSGSLDFEALRARAQRLPGVVAARVVTELCGREGERAAREFVEKSGLDRVVVAACTPRLYEETISGALAAAGLNRHMVEMVNLREQCAWAHRSRERATEKAAAMVSAAAARAAELEPLEAAPAALTRAALVLGGGVAGMQAALDLARAGNRVYLVEVSGALGGRTYRLSSTFPTQECKPDGCCAHSCRDCVLTPRVEEVLRHPLIEVLLNSRLRGLAGPFGSYTAAIETPGGLREVQVGAVVVATGSRLIDPRLFPELGYGVHPDVVTSLELEEMLVAARAGGGGLRRPSDGSLPRVFNFIQCVGSRDATGRGRAHCSLVCCTYAIGQAKELKRRDPGARVYIHYIDLRGPYRGFEEHYREAREMGVEFVRGRVAEVRRTGGGLVVVAEDIDTGRLLRIRSDLVVLSVGQEASEGTEELSRVLRVPLDRDGFLREYNASFDMLNRRGVAVVGCAAGPRGIRYSVEDARAAAAALSALLAPGEVPASAVRAEVDEGRCSGCRQCEALCPTGAISMRPVQDRRRGTKRWVARVSPQQCSACGACAVACPSKAVSVRGHRPRQLMEQIEGFSDAIEVRR
ncbi:MAG: CoB--CoM heterodisulfide reductase iron-sulfur subunit A family protein [Thermoplasmatota archaeon]